MPINILNILPTNQKYLPKLELFLQAYDLAIDYDFVQFIVFEDDELNILACAAISAHGIIKCVAIKDDLQGDGILLSLLTEVIKVANEIGCKKLFIYTKLANAILFEHCGFTIIVTAKNNFVLMENKYQPIQAYCANLSLSKKSGNKIGSIVMNANPFTLGHQYLIQQAASQCDWLHIFVLKEEQASFSTEDRMQMIIAGCANFNNVTIHSGGDYVISRTTFPTYFLKKASLVDEYYIEIDLMIFRQYIAPALDINYRFVGTEPNCQLTNNYNKKMQQLFVEDNANLPIIKVVEIPRLKNKDNLVISASEVRRRLHIDKAVDLTTLVPATTVAYLKSMDKFNLS